ncbi:MAG TPA: citrate/2-methylcitrate synthase [Candidatus Brocadiia bacterium]|nr:citrate/2-methylcitrate synthase [Candidatus Brocadiia bacterium]
MWEETKEITEIVLRAARKASQEPISQSEQALPGKAIHWPVECAIGPGLEGAIACESKVGYVNGLQGQLVYRGYDIFELCAYSCFEETCYLLLHGRLPTSSQFGSFRKQLAEYRHVPKTLRLLMSFPVEGMNAMGALRMGTNLMRQEFTFGDLEIAKPDIAQAHESDEDTISSEADPGDKAESFYSFDTTNTVVLTSMEETIAVSGSRKPAKGIRHQEVLQDTSSLDSCCHLIAGAPTLTAAIARIRNGQMPIEPDPELSHAANYLYMMTGRRPTEIEERIMDIALILHADHGMNASTFAAMVVASTLSDIYFSVGAGIAALAGPLHGGANEQVIHMLRQIGGPSNAKEWYAKARARKEKIMGFGHRVYKAYDPRASVLGPLARHLALENKEAQVLFRTAEALEKEVIADLGQSKSIYPNVDFYSGIVYSCLGIPTDMFTPTFAVSRVAGWCARVLEYLKKNRIFRPRAIYTGRLGEKYIPIDARHSAGKPSKR